MKTIYHIFTNNRDEWMKNYDRAYLLYQKWCNEFGNARLYEELWNNTKTDDEPKNENCLESFGEYPT